MICLKIKNIKELECEKMSKYIKPNEEKKEYGMEVNRARTFFNDKYTEILAKLEEERINKKLKEAVKLSNNFELLKIRKF